MARFVDREYFLAHSKGLDGGMVSGEAIPIFECQCTSGAPPGPPCYPLVRDSDPLTTYHILVSAQRWPTHLCPATMKLSGEVWKNERFAVTGKSRAELVWSAVWPMPIGKSSLARESEQFQSQGVADGEWQSLYNLMPFDGDEMATLSLAVRIPGSSVLVDLFGTAVPSQKEPGLLVAGPMLYRVAGYRDKATDALVNRLITRAQRWWNKFEKRPIRGSLNAGRPKGSGTFKDGNEFTRAAVAAASALREQGRTFTQANLAAYFSGKYYKRSDDCEPQEFDSRTIRHYLSRFHLGTWGEFSSAVTAESSGRKPTD